MKKWWWQQSGTQLLAALVWVKGIRNIVVDLHCSDDTRTSVALIRNTYWSGDTGSDVTVIRNTVAGCTGLMWW